MGKHTRKIGFLIKKYCFNCYKIQIDLKDVVNLIKVFFIFNNINLENNNIRKCIVETRKNVSGNYKGYIFCNGLDEAKNIIKIVSREIKSSTPIEITQINERSSLKKPKKKGWWSK